MTIRYQRVGLKIERVPTEADVEAALQVELGAAQQEADALHDQTAELRKRLARFKRDVAARAALRRRLFPKTPIGVDPPGPSLAAQDVIRARQLVGLSQRELAAQLGLHRSCVGMVELGKRRPHPPLARWAAGVLRAKGVAPEEDGARNGP